MIFPFLLLAYVWLFERTEHFRANRRAWSRDPCRLPAFLVTAAAAILTAQDDARDFPGGRRSGCLYRLTQPWVALHYFKSFFLPTELSADTDWTYVSGPFSGEALAGLRVRRRPAGRGVLRLAEPRDAAHRLRHLWFFLALVPTSLMPLAEVTNDHRMFFPFVGLALAVFWSLRLVLVRYSAAGSTGNAGGLAGRSWLRVAVAAAEWCCRPRRRAPTRATTSGTPRNRSGATSPSRVPTTAAAGRVMERA